MITTEFSDDSLNLEYQRYKALNLEEREQVEELEERAR